MKWFEIENQEQAEVLRAYLTQTGRKRVRIRSGSIVGPSMGSVIVTDWPDYPEADRLSFDQCMSIVRDEVTDDVMEELGGEGNFLNLSMRWQIYIDTPTAIELQQIEGQSVTSQIVENMTATKLRILAAILQGKEL
jgi:hypothetical protein